MPVKSQKHKKIYNDNFTGEVFQYHIEPQSSNEPSFIIDAPLFKMYLQAGKAYIIDGSEITEINIGSFNSVIQLISGLSNEAAADKVKTMFRSNSIKKAKSEIFYKKMYQRL